MPTSVVHVQYNDGKPAKGVRVVLGFSAGMTKAFYTDSRGDAVIDHASTREATVCASGKSYHSFHAPGRTAVRL
jgi:hypothetical protein